METYTELRQTYSPIGFVNGELLIATIEKDNVKDAKLFREMRA